MDLKALRKKIQETEQKKNDRLARREANPYLVQIPENEMLEVRFVTNNESETGFTPIYVHYSRNGVTPQTVVSPKTFGKSDPVEDFIQETLSKQKVSKLEYKKLMNKMPKLMYIAKVLVRGKEQEGVKLFLINGGSSARAVPYDNEGQFGKLLKAEQRAFRKEKEVPDWADLRNGYDIEIEKVGVEGKLYAEISYNFARTASKAWHNKQELDEWIENQPSWKQIGYEIWSYEQIEEAFEKALLNEDDFAEDDSDDNDSVENYSAPSPTTSKADEDEILQKAKMLMDASLSNDDDDEEDEEAPKVSEKPAKKSSSKVLEEEQADLDW
jgi:hypothetical protein